MNVLLIGNGGREHALAWKLAQSPLLTPGKFFALPGNPGIAAHCRICDIAIDDHAAIGSFCRDNAIELVIIGPEGPLAAGLADHLRAQAILVFGPSAKAARLESSKAYTKAFCARHAIPTADYGVFTQFDAARRFLDNLEPPFVLKADGLASGKGVIITADRAQAESEISELLDGRFGAASQTLVIERFMPGKEASFFALCDGEHVLAFGDAQDHKRAFDQDLGPNTGGMGAVSPVPWLSDTMRETIMREIIRPTIQGMAQEGCPFNGILFAGLMIHEDKPSLIEYNVRFGDPECQTLMLRLEDDLLPFLLAAARGELASLQAPRFSPDMALSVVLAAPGYPQAARLGGVIRHVEFAEFEFDARIFHAGTRRDAEGLLRAAGGRVLHVCAKGTDVHAARREAYGAMGRLELENSHFRSDIGLV